MRKQSSPDDRGAALRGAAMDRAVFADAVAGADAHVADGLGAKGEVLRIAAEHRAVADEVSRPEDHVRADDRMGLDDAAVADLRGALDDRAGADLDVAAELGRRVDNGGGVDGDAHSAGKRARRARPRLFRELAAQEAPRRLGWNANLKNNRLPCPEWPAPFVAT